MVTKTIVITDEQGLHLRPATSLCTITSRHDCHITFALRGNTYNAKSVISVLAAMVKQGDEIVVTCEGEDEQEAMKAIVEYAESKKDIVK